MFDGADLRRCSFIGADLRGASLVGVSLLKASFRRADLRGAALRTAQFDRTLFLYSRVEGVDVVGAVGTLFIRDPVIEVEGQDVTVSAERLLARWRPAGADGSEWVTSNPY